MLKTQIAGACFVAVLAASPTFAQKVPDFTTPQGPPALSDVPADSAGSTRETWEQMTREWEARQRSGTAGRPYADPWSDRQDRAQARRDWEEMTREWEARQRMQGWRESDAPRTSMAPSGAVPR